MRGKQRSRRTSGARTGEPAASARLPAGSAVRRRGFAARPEWYAAPAAAGALQRKHQRPRSEQQARRAAPRPPVAERKPGAEDAGGEHLHAEVRDRAEVGERFHQRERGARGDRRPRQRQRNAKEAAPGAMPGRRAGFDGAARHARGTRCARAGKHTDRARRTASPPRRRASAYPETSTRAPASRSARAARVCTGPVNCSQSV